MESYQEDLLSNPFFVELQKRNAKLYQRAEKECFIICVPRKDALRGIKLTKEFLETHILEPSPYFQGEYYTLSKKTVDIEDADAYIKTKENFAEPRRVKILFEELFYNKQSKPFRVLCIDIPLEGGRGAADSLAAANPKTQEKVTLPQVRGYKESTEFLHSFPENEIVLQKIDKKIFEFNKSYFIVPGYEEHAIKKLKEISQKALEDLICTNQFFKMLHYTNRHMTELTELVDSYIMGGVHKKLFPRIAELNASGERRLAGVIAALNLVGISQEALGVRTRLQRPLPETIAKLRTLNDSITPFEKALCIKEAMGLLSREAVGPASSSPRSASPLLGGGEDASNGASAGDDGVIVTAEDIIPLLTWALVQAQPPKLHTNAVYLGYFASYFSSTELGYAIATLQAAIQNIFTEASRRKLEPADTGSDTGADQSTDEFSRKRLARQASVPALPSAHSLNSAESLPSAALSTSTSSTTPFRSLSPPASTYPPKASTNAKENVSTWRHKYSATLPKEFSVPPSSLQRIGSVSSAGEPGHAAAPTNGVPPDSGLRRHSAVFQSAPAVIALDDTGQNGEGELGDFLTRLRSMKDDALSGRQWQIRNAVVPPEI